MSERPREFSAGETRRIGFLPGNRVVADSEGRGWRDVHASLAKVTNWTGVHAPHDHHCIAYCVNQPAFLRRRIDSGREEATTLRPRQFFVIPGQVESEWHRNGRSEMLMIYIRQEMLDGLARDLSSQSGARFADAAIDIPLGASDPLLEQFALSILTLLKQPDDGSSGLYVDTLARAAAVHLLRRHRRADAWIPSPDASLSADPGASKLRRAIDYIEDRIAGDLRLSTLAREAAVSVTALGRAFQAAYGMSPHQYVLSRRLERARRLLLSTDKSIVQIAFETGFSSQSHFTTAFGKLTGLTPAEFRSAES